MKRPWRALVVADLTIKAVAAVVIFPVIALAFRMFVALSGRDVLADEDILRFFLSPLGLLAIVLAGGLALAAMVLEQAVLLRILWASQARRSTSAREVLVEALADVLPTVKLSGLLVASTLLLATPYLLGVGLLYWGLLTGHDINYYLAEKPPTFWLAVALAACVLLGGLVAFGWWASARVLSIPILVVRRGSIQRAIALSREVSKGHQTRIARWLIAWLATMLLVPPLLLAGYFVVGGWLAHHLSSLSTLVVVVGVLMLVQLVLNLAVQIAGPVSFAAIVWRLWQDCDPQASEAIAHAVPQLETTRRALVAWNKRRLTAVAVVVLLSGVTLGTVSLAGIRTTDDVQVIAHRGGAATAPENSLAANRQAIEQQTDWIEIDIQETSDGRLAVVHDRDLMRIAGEAMEVHSSTLDQLQQADIGESVDAKFAGERVATLRQVLDLAKDNVGVVIELKHYGFNQQLEQRTIDLVEELDMAGDVIIISLDRKSIAKVRQLRPAWPVGLLTAVKMGDLLRVDADLLAVKADIATSTFIDRAHLAGREVAAWTANDRPTIQRVISRGVDYVITDNVPLARQVIDDRADWSLAQRWLMALAADL